MAKIPLTFACGLYDRMLALYTGEVQAGGIDLDFIAIDDPRQIFDRMGRNLEFDACEMSSSEVISRHAAGRREMVALPVFPSRVFRHGFITVNRKAVRTPKDLAGKRIGTPLYTQTAALFIRGLLQDEYRVDLSGVHWVQGATNSAESHGHPSAPPLLKPVSIEQNASGRSLSELLEAGEIQAIIGSGLPLALRTNPDVQRLFPDFHARELDYYRRTRIFPIMHLVAIRRDVYERHPFVAASLYQAMTAAKDLALAKMRDLGALRYMLPGLPAELDQIDATFGGDPWPYGVEANRPTLEAGRAVTDQGAHSGRRAVRAGLRGGGRGKRRVGGCFLRLLDLCWRPHFPDFTRQYARLESSDSDGGNGVGHPCDGRRRCVQAGRQLRFLRKRRGQDPSIGDLDRRRKQVHHLGRDTRQLLALLFEGDQAG